MSLEDLLSNRKIEAIEEDKALVEKTFRLALRDLETAKRNLENEDYDWALAIAYNSMLQSGRALMFSKGYRPTGAYKHVGVIEFIHDVFGKDVSDKLIYIFDKLRKKRHRVVYDDPDIVSEDEAENAINVAGEFVSMVKEILKV